MDREYLIRDICIDFAVKKSFLLHKEHPDWPDKKIDSVVDPQTDKLKKKLDGMKSIGQIKVYGSQVLDNLE